MGVYFHYLSIIFSPVCEVHFLFSLKDEATKDESAEKVAAKEEVTEEEPVTIKV